MDDENPTPFRFPTEQDALQIVRYGQRRSGTDHEKKRMSRDASANVRLSERLLKGLFYKRPNGAANR